MKKLLSYMFLLIVSMCFIITVKADLNDYSGGNSGSLGNLTGGEWNTYTVGMKVSIVNSSNKVKDVEIFLNSKGESSGNFSSNNRPKTHQSASITWVAGSKVTTYKATFLPDRWFDSNNKTVDLYNILYKDNYKNLKLILEHESLKNNITEGDYIIVEPMTKIGSYYGTAYELANGFKLTSKCGTKGSFCWTYAKAVFSGNSNQPSGGIFYNTLYLRSNVLNLTTYSDPGSSIYSERRKCFMSSTCGLGIGVFSYNDIYPGGYIEIKKYKEGTSLLIMSDSATFEIYRGENCNGTIVDTANTSGGIAKTKALSSGVYSIKEKKVPGEDKGNNKPYAIPNDRCVVKSITVNVSTTTSVPVYNTPTCTTKLNELGKNPTINQLLNLYNEYPSFNNLLNFDNPSCSVKDCKSSTKQNETLITNCLTATGETSSFTANDLSCYDEKYSDYTGFYTGFCKNTLDLKNNLGANKFYANAGQFLIHKTSTDIYKIYDENLNPVEINSKYIATATLKKDCYILNNSSTFINEELPNINLYFNDEEQELNYDKVDNTPLINYEGNFTKYTYSAKYNYKLNDIYLEKLTGKVFKEKTDFTTDAIEAVSSNFIAKEGNIYFDLVYNGKNAKKDLDYCTYSTRDRLVKNDNLDLELRLIDTKKPFNRITKSNWCDGTDCSKDNDIVKKHIIDSVNSYGLEKDGNKREPIYKIILDSTSIKTIRKYNESNQYSYYKLINIDGVMVTAFVYDLKNGVLNQYKEDDTIDYSFGTLKYKLEETKTK